jgi:large subunit ribosomal protein L50
VKSVILNESIGKFKVKYQKPVKPSFQHEPIVPLNKLSFDKPVSGTLVHDEDLAETNRHEIKFDGQLNSLTARGFLRFQKSYDPPENVRERLMSLVHSLVPTLKSKGGSDIMAYPLTDSRFKYDLLSKAFEEFQHAVPNSMLYMVQTIGDVDQFYHTPVKTTTPYDELARTKDLPPNLHIQKEPLRFNPETDTMFGGVSAFPKSSTLVTGLYARRKFKGTVAKRVWP